MRRDYRAAARGKVLEPLAIHIGASFTAEPFERFENFWRAALGRAIKFSVAPYGQLFQQLLTPGAPLQGGMGPTFIFVRWSDLAGGDAPEAAAEELARVLVAGRGRRTVVLCSSGEKEVNRIFRAHAPSNVEVVAAAEIFSRYCVSAPEDHASDEAAHIPFTNEAFAAFSCYIMRRAIADVEKPLKLIAVDGDNTLWAGVLGESGPDGVTLSPGYRAFQERLARQAEAGRMIVLLSKNDERDIDALFAKRADFPLRPEHILARGVNWKPKAENLSAIAAHFGVSEDAILFLDDNPVEVAAMRAAMPGVAAVQTPPGSAQLERFAAHYWPFDCTHVTAEDHARLSMYRDDVAREEERRAAPSLQEFIDSLELQVEIFEADAARLDRLAQLTQRTNQFNINLRRFSPAALARWKDQPDRCLYGVSVHDRFGDYGVVGLIGAEIKRDTLAVAFFMLSCRALGRGVEHQMAAQLGALATELGKQNVCFEFEPGPRNEPASAFLNEGIGANPGARSLVAADSLCKMQFHVNENNAPPCRRCEGGAAASALQDDCWLRIAKDYTTGATILSAACGEVKERPVLSIPFAVPAPGLERGIAEIWEDILRVAPVGAHDPFTELGGKSIELVRIHSRLQQLLGRSVELTLLFENSTPARLAARLEGRGEERFAAALRAAAMRAARTGHHRSLKRIRGGIH